MSPGAPRACSLTPLMSLSHDQGITS
uniref:Uncharacterized protein n=1 Tax=Anguilla anguilla TaxID=7936 RepID=A0A0E9QFE9_ANGAN